MTHLIVTPSTPNLDPGAARHLSAIIEEIAAAYVGRSRLGENQLEALRGGASFDDDLYGLRMKVVTLALDARDTFERRAGEASASDCVKIAGVHGVAWELIAAASLFIHLSGQAGNDMFSPGRLALAALNLAKADHIDAPSRIPEEIRVRARGGEVAPGSYIVGEKA